MEKRLAREILDEGSHAYSDGLMRGFSNWARDYSCVNGEREFLKFYAKRVGEMNLRGASKRLYSIDSEVQEAILEEFFSSSED